jgi:hypothetical protein
MNPTHRRVAALAAALSTIVIAASGPAAARADDGGGAAIGLLGWGGTPAAFLEGPVVGQLAAVVGPFVLTTAPSTYINSNTQIAAGLASNGVQASAGTTASG